MFLHGGDWKRESWHGETCQRGTRSNSGVRAPLNPICWTIRELNPVCHDSTAALRPIVACSFCVQSAILSALMASVQPRDDNSSSTNSSEDEDEDRQAPAAPTSGASESATAAAATTSDDCCEVCIVAPCWLRAGAVWTRAAVLWNVCYACVSYGWECPVCGADIIPL